MRSVNAEWVACAQPDLNTRKSADGEPVTADKVPSSAALDQCDSLAWRPPILTEDLAMPTDATDLPELPRDLKDVVTLLADGATNADIATALVLALHTVEGYVSAIKLHAGARDRVDLVLKCRQWVA